MAGCAEETGKVDHIEAYTSTEDNMTLIHVIFKDKNDNNIFMTSETEYNLKIQFFKDGLVIYDFDYPWYGMLESGLSFKVLDFDSVIVTVTLNDCDFYSKIVST